ncbi:MAG: hypothetical protein AB7G93_19890 [Bdellovibrionales bacterium]
MNAKLLPKHQSVLGFISEKLMEAQIQTQDRQPQYSSRKLSMQMRAVLLIFNADPYLMEAVAPHINLETESIQWEKIFKLPFSSGHKAAAQWAFGVWRDEALPRANFFDSALSMSPHLKVAVLEALCLRWGLRG